MTNNTVQDRQPNMFYRTSETSFIGSYFAMIAEFHEIILEYGRPSRNGNAIWNVLVPSPRTGVLFPIGTATYMHGETEDEGPYFLGRIEDPSGIIPFKIAPQDPGDEAGPWLIRYNPPLTATPSQAQGQSPRQQPRSSPAQRPTTLGPGAGYNRAFDGAGPNGHGRAEPQGHGA